MKALGILKLDELFTHQCATLIHDIQNKRAPPPISELLPIEQEQPRHRLRSHVSDPNHIRTSIPRSKTGSNGFCIKGPNIWNSWSQELQSIRSKHSFKNQLKQHLLRAYDDRTSCNNSRCNDRRHHHH